MLLCLFYTTIKFFLYIRIERFTQYVFFIISFLYLINIFVDDYKRFLKKEFILPYLMILFAIISILASCNVGLIGIRSIIMFIINFIAITIDDPHDSDYIKTFEYIVLLILIISNVHTILCLIFCVTDILQITSLGVYMENRLHGFAYFNGTGELALLGIGSIVYFFDKANYNINNKYFICNIVFTLLHIVVLILTQNRLALYGLILCVIVYFIIKMCKERQQIDLKKYFKYIVFMFAFIAVIYIVLLNFNIFKIRKFSLLSNERVDIWVAFLSVFIRENMLFGLGPDKAVQLFKYTLGNNSLQSYINYFNDYNLAYKIRSISNFFEPFMPHNEFIRHMIMFGLVGTALIIIYVINIFYKLIKVYRNDDRFCSLISYLSVFYIVFPLISGCVENTFSFTNSPRYFINFVFFFVVGYVNKMYDELSIVANH